MKNQYILAVLLECALAGSALGDEFDLLAGRCAPAVDVSTMRALVKTESGFNPFAIGVVGGSVKQPTNLEEALHTVESLRLAGRNFSVGLGQINQANFKRLNVDARTLFEPCANLKAAQTILIECYERTAGQGASEGRRLADAMSCYYSGNESTGYVHGYVHKIAKNAPSPGVPTKIPPVYLLNEYMGIAPGSSYPAGDTVLVYSLLESPQSLISTAAKQTVNDKQGLVF